MNVASFLPNNDHLTSARRVNLDGTDTPQVAVTALATTPTTRHVSSTVLLLVWNSTANRWTVVFDASKQPSFALQTDEAGAARTDRAVPTPNVAVVHDQANGGADLVYWLNSRRGNSSSFLVGVVHYANNSANLVWSFDTDDIDTSLAQDNGVVVDGTAPSQQIQITLPWNTQTDPANTAVRTYSFVVAPASNNTLDEYRILSDTRPLVGVGIVAVAGSTQGRVAYLPAGSPASGSLQLGDLIDGVDGISPPSRSRLVPAVIDEVAVHDPGDKVALDIERHGQPAVVTIQLGQWNFLLGQSGYSGVVSGTLGVYLQVLQTSVVVNATVPGGPADTAGIGGGSTLTSVNGIPIHTIANVQAALRGASAGDTATVGYVTPQGTPTTTRVDLGTPSGTIPSMLYTL
ncbi:MAG: PDZ domain-containing protein [Acidimicrobiia bacterium]